MSLSLNWTTDEWKTKTKAELFKILDNLYKKTGFDRVIVDDDRYSNYIDGAFCSFFDFFKGKEHVGRLYFYTWTKKRNPENFYKRARMAVEWKEKRNVKVDVSKVPLGEGECVLCGVEITLYPGKPPVCKNCIEIYELGKKEKERRDSFENLSREIDTGYTYTNNPSLFPLYQFKQFLNEYVPHCLFKEGAGDALGVLEKIVKLTNEYNYLSGVVDGKKLLRGLNEGTVSLNSFENPSLKERLENIKKQMMELNKTLYNKK